METALSTGSKIVEPLLARPLRIIFDFKTIVDDFNHHRERLNSEQVRVEGAITEATTHNGHKVHEHVAKWVEDAKRVMGDAQKLQNKLRDDKSCCFSTGWTYHYCLSNKVWENTDSIKNLCERAASLKEVAHPFDLRQHIGLRSSEDFVPSKSMDSAVLAIMEALVNEDVNKIGLYGMGGSGLSTLAEQVVKESERRGITDRAFIASFPQTAEEGMIRSIQDIIADYTNFKLEEESEQGRATRLHGRLTNGDKILIILDGVSKAFDPAKVGIPTFCSCKFMFITSDLHVCNSMQTQGDSITRLGVLSEDEAWTLFKSVAGVGDVVRRHDVINEIVESCKGLPKVIINVARAVREKEPSQWEETLQQLKSDKLKIISDDLHKGLGKLSERKQRVANQVEIAKNNAQLIETDVKKWLENVERVINDVEQLENELNQNIICFNEQDELISKKGAEMINFVQKLYEDGIFHSVSHADPIPQEMGLSFSEDYLPSESSESAFRKIMAALKNDNVNKIELCGMGGSGKTTLAKKVHKEVGRLKIFDHVIMVSISQTPDIRRIQGVIADLLDLKLNKETEEGRANKLRGIMKTKKILLILDDVWKKFDLTDIGMSADELNGCKILLTTRQFRVRISMRCEEQISLELLSDDEAWVFFKKKAYLHDGSDMEDVAKDIVGECGRLPIALATVGSALRNRNRNYLVEALKMLKDARLVDIPEVSDDEKNVYKCLQLSYDYLKGSASGHEAQLLLLLCSLFPEDYEISIEDLTRIAFGMKLFERVVTVHDARGEVRVVVQCLLDSCLLLRVAEKECVQIHDVVRDVALWIGGRESPEKRVFILRDGRDMSYLVKKETFKNCRAISIMPKCMSELCKYELVCPNLETMLIFGGDRGGVVADFPGAFFYNVKALKVLDISEAVISLPQSLGCLTGLDTLNLRYCHCSNSSLVGKLQNLRILNVCHSMIDTELEEMLVELKKLKLLDLIGTSNYEYQRKLPSTVIENLLNLEELYTYGEWEPSPPVDFCFPNLKYYYISFSEDDRVEEYDRGLVLNELNGSHLNAFQELFPTVEYLETEVRFKNIIPCMVDSLVASKGFLQNLKELVVRNSEEPEALFELEGNYESPNQLLERLKIHDLWKLKHIWKGPLRSVHLSSLTHVEIFMCPKLKTIFSSALCTAPILQKLQSLIILHCSALEEVFSASVDAGDFSCYCQNLKNLRVLGCPKLKGIFSMHMPHSRLHLPKLQKISLVDNKELEQIFSQYQSGSEVEQWPSLEVLEVSDCPKLSSQFIANLQTQLQAPLTAKQLKTINLEDMQGVEQIMQLQKQDQNDQELMTFDLRWLRLINLPDLKYYCVWSHTIHNISFSYLTDVEVRDCNKLKQLFSVATARSLNQLEELSLAQCNELEEIIVMDNIQHVSDDQTNMISITFPRLQMMKLKDLPSLIKFCPAAYNVVLPSLRKRNLKLEGCPQTLTDFFSGQRVTLMDNEE